MKRHSLHVLATLLAVGVLGIAVLRASDYVGVYAVVEKIVMEPSDSAPERIQLWGAFALADRQDRDTYKPAERGYLYYKCPAGRETTCRNEWLDLKSMAGSGRAVAFGGRDVANGRLRKLTDKPEAPDDYPIHIGVRRLTDSGGPRSIIDGLKAALRTP